MQMNGIDWIREFPGAVTLCDLHGIVLEMNEKAAETFQKYGGKESDRQKPARLPSGTGAQQARATAAKQASATSIR